MFFKFYGKLTLSNSRFFALARVVYRFKFDLSDFFGKIMVWGFWAKMCWK